MRPFVSELADLHRLAVSTASEDFPAEVVGHLHRWIDFDGAVFGFGEPQDDTLKIATATVYGRDDAILQEYAEVSHEDPVTAAFLIVFVAIFLLSVHIVLAMFSLVTVLVPFIPG